MSALDDDDAGAVAMTDIGQERTLGEAVSNLTLTTVAVLAGLALAVIGSIGPWATTPFGSVSGTNGDGKITIGLAVIATGFCALRPGAKRWVPIALATLAIVVVGIYDAIHIHHAVAGATLFGTQIAHVGWGVYAVIAGGAIAFVAALRNG